SWSLSYIESGPAKTSSPANLLRIGDHLLEPQLTSTPAAFWKKLC
ncbi:unnamed protein product, partial [Amoebophrya sp. A120]